MKPINRPGALVFPWEKNVTQRRLRSGDTVDDELSAVLLVFHNGFAEFPKLLIFLPFFKI